VWEKCCEHVLEPKTEEVPEEWRQLLYKEHHNLKVELLYAKYTEGNYAQKHSEFVALTGETKMRTKFHFEDVNVRNHLRDTDIDAGTIRM
jgi:hypothetical protein